MPKPKKHRVRKSREALGWTQAQLAAKSGYGHRTIQKVEAGQTVNAATLSDIAGALGVAFQELVEPEHDVAVETADAFREGPFDVNEFSSGKHAPCELTICRSESDVEAGVRRMRQTWLGLRSLFAASPDRQLCRAYNAIAAAPLQNQIDRYIAIWRKNPRSIRFAVRSKERVGISIVLPIRESAYEQFRSGFLSYLQVTAKDVLAEGQNLLIDAATEFELPSAGVWPQTTSALKFASFYHIAEQAKHPARDDFRMISFGGNPDNAARLVASGFVRLPTIMRTIGSPLYEFSEHVIEDETQRVRQATLALYMKLWRLPLGGSDFKRRALKAALAVCKRLSTFRSRQLKDVA